MKSLKNSLKNIYTKIGSLKKTDKIQIILWILSLIMLLIFVFVAAFLSPAADASDATKAAIDNTKAGIALVFVLILCSSLLTTVFIKASHKVQAGEDV